MDNGAVRKEQLDLIVRPAYTPPEPESLPDSVYADLLNRVFFAGPDGHAAVAFTACTPGAGVGFVVNSLARVLARKTANPVLGTQVAAMRRINNSCMAPVPGSPNLWTMAQSRTADSAGSSASGWESSVDFRVASMKALRSTFQYLLFDCGPMRTSDDISLVARHCDGVVLVVEADRTRPPEIERARIAIESGGGKLLGCVLNKRKYPVPDWLYRWLSPEGSGVGGGR